jgi:hypothetical protein
MHARAEDGTGDYLSLEMARSSRASGDGGLRHEPVDGLVGMVLDCRIA